MVTESFVQEVLAIQPENVERSVPMSRYTTFQIGGPADLFVEPAGEEAFSRLVKLCRSKNVPFLLIGAGSNLLVSDAGIDGVVFRLSGAFDYAKVSGTELAAGAATSLAKLAKTAQRAALSGLEFASGIPGSLGGAVFMNAGAYGGEMKDVVIQTRFLDENGNMQTVSDSEHDFSYRHSVFSAGGKFILSAKMSLSPKNPDEILTSMRDLNARRKEKQPLEKPSAGSTFKRPEGFFAAKLIEDAGLKGAGVGGAGVSEKHAGFIVNNGGATCEDVVRLIAKVQETVFSNFGVMLEPEVKVIGR